MYLQVIDKAPQRSQHKGGGVSMHKTTTLERRKESEVTTTTNNKIIQKEIDVYPVAALL